MMHEIKFMTGMVSLCASMVALGSGEFTVTWNAAKVKLSDHSLIELLKIDGATMEGNSITFDVDSGNKDRYDVQFYKVTGGLTGEEEWDDIVSYVTYAFVLQE